MKGLVASSLILLISFVSGCTQDIHSREGFFKYVKDKDNGLLQEVKKSDVLTSASYVPFQIIYNKKWNFQKNSNSNSGKSSKICFIISFSRNGKELLSQLDLNVYSDVLQTLSFQMIPLVSLKMDDEHVISPTDCLFQQTYGLSPANELLLVFDSDEIKASKNIV
ncbi:hypothetical protein [Pedobacter panaciterrae]